MADDSGQSGWYEGVGQKVLTITHITEHPYKENTVKTAVWVRVSSLSVSRGRPASQPAVRLDLAVGMTCELADLGWRGPGLVLSAKQTRPALCGSECLRSICGLMRSRNKGWFDLCFSSSSLLCIYTGQLKLSRKARHVPYPPRSNLQPNS
jgi:hypothetical protein